MSIRKQQTDTLTSRQWRLHDLLDDGVYEHWYSKDEIIELLPELYQKNTNPYTHDVCPKLYVDSRDIQHNCMLIQKILITDKKGRMKFGNKEETKEYCEKLHAKAMKLLEIESILIERMNKDNFGRLFTDTKDPKPISETKAREFYDVFPMDRNNK